ncbi:MAG: hypothetical protein ABI681_12725 [Gemmatimonadales bacterium]
MSFARTFLKGIVDYAGLFPPATQGMADAVRTYAEYRSGEDRALLGRFVVPIARIDKFSAAAESVLPRGDGAEPWRVSVIAGGDLSAVREKSLHFNCSHWQGSDVGHAICDSIELPVRSAGEIAVALSSFPTFFRIFLEIPVDTDPERLIASLAGTRGGAKIRTGGTVESAIPDSATVLRFIKACHRHGVPFKATAGLHHAIRGLYPLTYEPNAPRALMFGYLNVFLAAAAVEADAPDAYVLDILNETDASAFLFTEKAVWYRDLVMGGGQFAAVRERVALSFGSCSFTEPVSEAKTLGII